MKEIYAGCLRRGQHFSINETDYVVDNDQSGAAPDYIMCYNSVTHIYRQVHHWTLVTIKGEN